jgi:hypothetical protein
MPGGSCISGMAGLNMMKKNDLTVWLAAFAFLCLSSVPASGVEKPFQINGHARTRGDCSWHDTDSIFSVVGTRPYWDRAGELRLKNDFYFSEELSLQTHYEAAFSGGDTRRKSFELLDRLGFSDADGLLFTQPIEDDRRLMDLTGILEDEKGYVGYHRLDRLALGITHKNVGLILGRQAQTWGNGMIFNPMDLFNPFSPTDILRDYKTGDDMISLRFSTENSSNFHLLAVPRRNPDHDVDPDCASLAGKWHFSKNSADYDIMAARHYQDYVVGFGATGYLKNTAWRIDGTWTFLHDDPDLKDEKQGYPALSANMDYSWVWREKNFYGFVELYHNGLGRSDPLEALADIQILDRIMRGELFTLGQNYFSALLQCELHPLFNAYCTVIANLHDGSTIFLPRAVWDVAENIQFIFGGILFQGGQDTEYGGIPIPATDLYIKAPSNAFIWWTVYF